MKKILCFFSETMADFEITLLFHKINTAGNHEIITIGYDTRPIVSESGLTYLPDQPISKALGTADIEALIIPGGPICPQRDELTHLIQLLDQKKKLLAAICNGPQYLGRAGILDRHPFTTSNAQDKIKSLNVADPFPWENYVDERVVQDQHIITAKGRAFVDFSFAVFDYLDIFKNKKAEQKQLYADIMDRA
jgi:putative intracellular protease/amidase